MLLKKYFWGILILFVGYTQSSLSQSETPDATVEAETGTLTGNVIVSSSGSGYSGSGYVTNFISSGDKVTVKMSVSAAGFYKLIIRYKSEYKEQYLSVNGSGSSTIVFPATSSYADVSAGKYLLNAGVNTFTISSYWGYINIDKFSLYAVPKNTYNVTSSLINSNADSVTQALYQFLVSNYSYNIISGQTDSYFSNVKTTAGKTPMLRAFDFQHYTDGYAYLWDNNISGHTFGWEDNGQTQAAIDWYNETEGKGIVSFQWHWHSPTGGTAGTNTFYTDYTNFSITQAIIPGTQENTDIIRDIDSIASQLKKLEKAGVPVLWRPLHEAGGGWFWWGAEGAMACKGLYHILYNRLTNYHGLNNLIWVWSTSESEWYPGNDSVDIVGYDSYPGEYNYAPQKSAFDLLYELVNGEKIIAMTENGPIPNTDDCFTNDAPWAYFMSWSELVFSQNTNEHIIEVFNKKNVLTIENPVETPVHFAEDNGVILYPNPARDKVTINGTCTSIEIFDMYGRIIYAGPCATNTINLNGLSNGMYLVKIYNEKLSKQQKLVIEK